MFGKSSGNLLDRNATELLKPTKLTISELQRPTVADHERGFYWCTDYYQPLSLQARSDQNQSFTNFFKADSEFEVKTFGGWLLGEPKAAMVSPNNDWELNLPKILIES